MGEASRQLPGRLKKDLSLVDEYLLEVVDEATDYIRVACRKVIGAGGKRLRPLLLLTAALNGKYDLDTLIPASAAVEMLHVSSLVHDDILDEASLRRGVPTINSLLGRRVALATGDYLFAKTFEVLASLNNPGIIELMAQAALALSQGELAQQDMAGWVETTEMSYLRRIRDKTAILFSTACQMGGLLAGVNNTLQEDLRVYGESLGMAFQIFDDILDVRGSSEKMGKPVGLDLKEGIVTLPVIYALEETHYDDRITRVIEGKSTRDKDIERAIEVIKGTKGIERALESAKNYIRVALSLAAKMKNREAQEGLLFVGEFVLEREF